MDCMTCGIEGLREVWRADGEFEEMDLVGEDRGRLEGGRERRLEGLPGDRRSRRVVCSRYVVDVK